MVGVSEQFIKGTSRACTHTRLTALFPGLPGWAGTRKVKPIWITLKQETVSGSGICWVICKSAPRPRQITTSAPHHSVFTGRMPFLPPYQQRQSTDGKYVWNTYDTYRRTLFVYIDGSAVVVDPVPRRQARSPAVSTSTGPAGGQDAPVVARADELQQGPRAQAVRHSRLEHALRRRRYRIRSIFYLIVYFAHNKKTVKFPRRRRHRIRLVFIYLFILPRTREQSNFSFKSVSYREIWYLSPQCKWKSV